MKKKKLKVRLLPHEVSLLQAGELHDVTHPGASSKWLFAPSSSSLMAEEEEKTLCYRHMGDVEFQVLLNTNQLPDTQPYQTLTQGQEGRAYCESYLRQAKYVDTSPTTVVEFVCAATLINDFYSIQSKIEDGTISHGLGKVGWSRHRQSSHTSIVISRARLELLRLLFRIIYSQYGLSTPSRHGEYARSALVQVYPSAKWQSGTHAIQVLAFLPPSIHCADSSVGRKARARRLELGGR